MFPRETAASISDEKIHIFRLAFHLIIVMLLFQVILEVNKEPYYISSDLQVNILPYYIYTAVPSDSRTYHLTIVMLLFQLAPHVNIFPKCRCADVSILSTFKYFPNYRDGAVSR